MKLTEAQESLMRRSLAEMPREMLERIADAFEEAECIRRMEERRRFRPRSPGRQP